MKTFVRLDAVAFYEPRENESKWVLHLFFTIDYPGVSPLLPRPSPGECCTCTGAVLFKGVLFLLSLLLPLLRPLFRFVSCCDRREKMGVSVEEAEITYSIIHKIEDNRGLFTFASDVIAKIHQPHTMKTNVNWTSLICIFLLWL